MGAVGTSGSGPRGRARIEDVARASEVSVATVSRALRGLPNVAESTRLRVMAVAADLHYQPDPAAARLAAGRTRTVIVMVPHLASWYFSTVIAGAEAVCNESGYEFVVVGVGSSTECTRLLADTTHLERRADGVIIVNIPVTDEQDASLHERRIALSTVGVRAGGAPSVFVDDNAVGHLAATTLAGLGHRRIAMLSGQDADPLNFAVPTRRAMGFRAGLADVGLTLPDDFVVGGNFGIDGGREAAVRLLDLPEPPTAVFAMSDEMAFGALMELEHRGLRPGVDVSVLGVDDHDASRVVGLSTIRQDVGSQGATAARSLVAEMSDGRVGGPTDRVEPVMSPIELVLRRTTGPVC